MPFVNVKTIGPVKRVVAVLSTAAVAVVAAAAVTVGPSGAQDPPPPIDVQLLTERAEFTDDVAMQVRFKLDGQRATALNLQDASRLVTARVTIQPGAMFPWHTHPGPVLINIAEGTFTYVNADDCVPRVYPAGTALVDPGYGNVHTAFNDTDEVVVVIATFLDVPAQGPLTITEGIEAPEGCDIEVGTHAH
jgi:quercetin dioxygenase-like cupin family protein